MNHLIQLIKICGICACILAFNSVNAQSIGQLSENIRIKSEVLDYSLQYRVYTPANMKENDQLSTIYIVDGQWYLSSGGMKHVLDQEIDSGNIKPVIAIFVDNRNPDNLSENRRNSQFFCNDQYVSFFRQELIPTIDNKYPTSKSREDRVIQGLSFGGYNAACFGLMANKEFAGISMQSPANSRMLKEIAQRYNKTEKLPIKMFLSFGSIGDNHVAGRKFRDVLLKKGYDVEYKEVKFGHEWKNWKPLLDDSLRRFFSISE